MRCRTIMAMTATSVVRNTHFATSPRRLPEFGCIFKSRKVLSPGGARGDTADAYRDAQRSLGTPSATTGNGGGRHISHLSQLTRVGDPGAPEAYVTRKVTRDPRVRAFRCTAGQPFGDRRHLCAGHGEAQAAYVHVWGGGF